VKDTKIVRAIREAREENKGNYLEKYEHVFDYVHAMLRSNPTSTHEIDYISILGFMPWFESFNVCSNSCKEGLKKGGSVDGCFLKGYSGGNRCLLWDMMPGTTIL